MFCSMFGLHKHAAVHFLVRAIIQSIKTSSMSAEDSRCICDNDHIWGKHLCNFVGKKVVQLCLVVIMPQEFMPVNWNGVLICHLASYPLAMFGFGFSFKV